MVTDITKLSNELIQAYSQYAGGALSLSVDDYLRFRDRAVAELQMAGGCMDQVEDKPAPRQRRASRKPEEKPEIKPQLKMENEKADTDEPVAEDVSDDANTDVATDAFALLRGIKDAWND